MTVSAKFGENISNYCLNIEFYLFSKLYHCQPSWILNKFKISFADEVQRAMRHAPFQISLRVCDSLNRSGEIALFKLLYFNFFYILLLVGSTTCCSK